MTDLYAFDNLFNQTETFNQERNLDPMSAKQNAITTAAFVFGIITIPIAALTWPFFCAYYVFTNFDGEED